MYHNQYLLNRVEISIVNMEVIISHIKILLKAVAQKKIKRQLFTVNVNDRSKSKLKSQKLLLHYRLPASHLTPTC